MLVHSDKSREYPLVFILLALISASIFAIATNIGLAIWMSKKINTMATESAKLLLISALDAKTERVVISTTDYALWDQGYKWLKKRDDAAVFSNIGYGATEDETFDLAYLLQSDGAPLYAYETGGEGSDLSIIDRSVTQAFIQAIKKKPIKPYDTVASFAIINSQITILVAGRVQPEDTSNLSSGDLDIMIGGLVLSPERLKGLADRLLIDDIQISLNDTSNDTSNHNIPIKDISGKQIANLSWSQSQPGNKILKSVIPIIAMLSFVLVSVSLIVILTSIRQKKAFLHERNIARGDTLTGLFNRSGLNEVMSLPEVEFAFRTSQLAFIYLDLNKLKVLNDTIGHSAGDAALKITATRLKKSIRANDFAVRMGGDEFLCVVIDRAPLKTANFIATRIIKSNEEPAIINNEKYTINTSIGIATAEPDVDWQTLLNRADMAMYHAKSKQQLTPAHYTSAMKKQHS